MTRPADRLTGRAAAAAAEPFATRAFGSTKAEAAAIAATAASAKRPGMIQYPDGTPVGGRIAGTTGPAGSGVNLTTSTYSAPATVGTSGGGASRGSARA